MFCAICVVYVLYCTCVFIVCIMCMCMCCGTMCICVGVVVHYVYGPLCCVMCMEHAGLGLLGPTKVWNTPIFMSMEDY